MCRGAYTAETLSSGRLYWRVSMAVSGSIRFGPEVAIQKLLSGQKHQRFEEYRGLKNCQHDFNKLLSLGFLTMSIVFYSPKNLVLFIKAPIWAVL